MKRKCGGRKEKKFQRNGRTTFGSFLLIAVVLFFGPAMAIDMDFLGKHLSITGYIDQGIQFGVAGDHYDTMSGFQQALTQAIVEFEYHPAEKTKVFVSGLLVKDWAYDIYDSDDDWGNNQPPKDPIGRLFKKSRSELSIYSDYEDYLKECHVNWSPGNFNIRVGKQIVSWGRMTAVRVMDQINPRDTRRGFADVEFETSIIPIWLAKAEYFPERFPGFLNDLSLECTFNPNADFIANKGIGAGNYQYGIWAADSLFPAALNGRAGDLIIDLEEPDSWDPEGYEYAVRLKGLLSNNSYFTLNYFNGVDNNMVRLRDETRSGGGIDAFGGASLPSLNGLPYVDDKGRQLIEIYYTGEYPDKEFAGFTFAHEFESLSTTWLGGVAPLLRCEALYEFDTVFATANRALGDRYEESDVIYWGMAVEWDVKWRLLNPRRNLSFEPGFSQRHILDYPSNYRFDMIPENAYQFTVMASTQYINDKLTPRVVYTRAVGRDSAQNRAKGDIWVISLEWVPNETWSYKAQLFLLENDLMDTINHKDNISFSVQYQF